MVSRYRYIIIFQTAASSHPVIDHSFYDSFCPLCKKYKLTQILGSLLEYSLPPRNVLLPSKTLYIIELIQRTIGPKNLIGTAVLFLWPDGAVNYDYVVTNSINSLLIDSRCIPNGAHTNRYGPCFKTYQKLHLP